MFKLEYMRNYTVRLLCAILLLVVQVDVLSAEACAVSPCPEIEWSQAEDGEAQAEGDVDDYYRQFSRPSARMVVALLPALTLLPALLPADQKAEVLFPVYFSIFPKGLNAQTFYCVFRI